MLKLNLGAGNVPVEGYTPIDRKHGQEVYPLSGYDTGSVDAIRASHILEHFSYHQILDVLTEWVRVLKVGGLIQIAVPDFRKIVQQYLNKEPTNVSGYLMGGHIDENDYHKALFDEAVLRKLMEDVGLANIQPWVSTVQDAAALPISLNLQGIKSGEQPPTMKRICDGVTGVAAVMSGPRVGFTDNGLCAMRALAPLKIPFAKSSGVFWGACLTRLIEDVLKQDYNFILTIDYDTWFTTDMVVRMAQLMRDHPEIDALIPLQIGREQESPLVGLRGPDGQPITEVSAEHFQKPLTEIYSGHFGLTMIAADVFDKLQKPWFQANPGPDGSWREGRIDEDIHFWNNFNAVGCRAFSANEIFLGHMQLMCTFPGPPSENFKPIHMYMGDLELNGPPEHCKVTIGV
jgi:hypothetical protein